MSALGRYRRWEYPGGVIVEVPLDSPVLRPPADLAEVPAAWVQPSSPPPADSERPAPRKRRRP